MSKQPKGKIFINYRRDDDPGFVQALYLKLGEFFSPEQLFMDVEGYIYGGEDFTKVITAQVEQCDVMLAVIGPRWIPLITERKNDPNDFLQIELKEALAQGKRIIPVLVNRASMPGPEDLPDAIQQLWRQNAIRLTHERFGKDCEGLLEQIAPIIDVANKVKRAEAGAEPIRVAPGRITRAEELASWGIIKESVDPIDYRAHLARYPGGETERMAKSKLEVLDWKELDGTTSRKAVAKFLADFPNGAFSNEARNILRVDSLIRLLIVALLIASATESILNLPNDFFREPRYWRAADYLSRWFACIALSMLFMLSVARLYKFELSLIILTTCAVFSFLFAFISYYDINGMLTSLLFYLVFLTISRAVLSIVFVLNGYNKHRQRQR